MQFHLLLSFENGLLLEKQWSGTHTHTCVSKDETHTSIEMFCMHGVFYPSVRLLDCAYENAAYLIAAYLLTTA